MLLWLRILPYSISMFLIFVLQKKHRVDYCSNAEELDRMMAAKGGGSNPKVGDGVEQKTVPSPSGQPESYDPVSSVRPMEVLIWIHPLRLRSYLQVRCLL